MERNIVSRIVEGCPKAFKALVDYVITKSGAGQEWANEVLPMARKQELLMLNTPAWHLYPFFDENDILVFPTPETPDRWCFNILATDYVPPVGKDVYPSRQRAEEMGFLTAFLLLESRL